jgi:flavin reductase (DIM6/NTAB) family NADH-FMN oxidoreductase RutF
MKIINPKDFDANIFRLLDDSWCLIASYDKNHTPLPYNAMTASWGGMGVLWNKNVFFCVVRPQRYTKEFIDNSRYISLSFFGEEMKKALTYCGRNSGRDGDKLKESGFTPVITDDGKVEFKEAKITVFGKKLFASDMKEADFIDKSLVEKNYPNNDFHTVYVCEIESIKVND